MMQGKSKRNWVLGAALLLGACSGGGSAPPVTTPPSPPPTPTAFPLINSDTLQAISVTQSWTTTAPPSSTVTAGSAALDPAGTVSVDYDSSSGTYTVHGVPGSASFTAADRTDSSGYIDTYSKQSGTVTDQLQLFGNIRSGGPQSGAPVQLTYLSYGVWTHSDSQSGQMQRSYALFGFPTPTSGMPRSGIGTY
jgi:hypothetical protein